MRNDRVVDASVVIKLVVTEGLSEEARELFSDRSLVPYVPDFLYIECTNILWKYVWRFNVPLQSARQKLLRLQRLRLRQVSISSLLQSVIQLASQYRLSAYDASYAALAQAMAIPLITADRKLIGKLADSEVEAVWLGELDL